MVILVLNCRSYSVFFHLSDGERGAVIAKGKVDRVEIGDSSITLEAPGRGTCRRETECPDHRAALSLILDTLTDDEVGFIAHTDVIEAVGHRVVHGGERFTSSSVIDDRVLAAIKEVEPLAPLHNAPTIAGIEASRALLPHASHVAVFDTAFHQTLPPHAYLYALPYDWYEKYGVRRYGFHGASHRHASKRSAALLEKKEDSCNLVTIHMGFGVSLCAVKNGVSIDTSMGLTPLEGAVMGTRCGDIDPGIPVFLMRVENLSAREIDGILNQKSGVLGIAGYPFSRETLVEEAGRGDRRCRLALDMEAYRLKKYIGSYCAAIGPIDALVFTSGNGMAEWSLRELALEGMEGFGIRLDRERNRHRVNGSCEALISTDDSPVKIFVIPTDEEQVITEEVAALLAMC